MALTPVADAVANIPDSAVKQGGMTHLTFYWGIDGHPPAAEQRPRAYDFHFYLVPAAKIRSDGLQGSQ